MKYEDLVKQALSLDTRPICKYCGTAYNIKPQYDNCYTCGAERTTPSIKIKPRDFIEISSRDTVFPTFFLEEGKLLFFGIEIKVVA